MSLGIIAFGTETVAVGTGIESVYAGSLPAPLPHPSLSVSFIHFHNSLFELVGVGKIFFRTPPWAQQSVNPYMKYGLHILTGSGFPGFMTFSFHIGAAVPVEYGFMFVDKRF